MTLNAFIVLLCNAEGIINEARQGSKSVGYRDISNN